VGLAGRVGAGLTRAVAITDNDRIFAANRHANSGALDDHGPAQFLARIDAGEFDCLAIHPSKPKIKLA
jgi:hypothetical protein